MAIHELFPPQMKLFTASRRPGGDCAAFVARRLPPSAFVCPVTESDDRETKMQEQQHVKDTGQMDKEIDINGSIKA